jgi:hypothetical protein
MLVRHPMSASLGTAAGGVWEEARGVSLSRRQLRTLRGIELDLTSSDPSLSASYRSFTARTAGCQMPRAEHIADWPFRMLDRLRPGRSVTERVRDWCAENWNDR